MADAVRLVVGLGNPGAEYAQTRHNAGAEFVAALAASHGETLRSDRKFGGLVGRVTVAGEELRLLVPETFYNASGNAAAPMLRFYRIEPAAMLVVHDELDLPLGVARLKEGGGHGGNNGVRDIIRALGGGNDFGRLRIGVGHPGDKARVTGFLLTRAPSAERQMLAGVIDEALRVMPELVAGRWPDAMTALHTRLRAPRVEQD